MKKLMLAAITLALAVGYAEAESVQWETLSEGTINMCLSRKSENSDLTKIHEHYNNFLQQGFSPQQAAKKASMKVKDNAPVEVRRSFRECLEENQTQVHPMPVKHMKYQGPGPVVRPAKPHYRGPGPVKIQRGTYWGAHPEMKEGGSGEMLEVEEASVTE